MLKKMIVALGALLVTASAANAYEERWPKWYVGINGSLPFVSDSDVTGPGTVGIGDIEHDSPGWGAGASLGYKPAGSDSFLDMMRFEIEYAYSATDIDTIGGVTATDDVTVDAYMFNAFVDFVNDTQFTPYIGAGIGWANVETSVPALGFDDSDDVFAYQGRLGVSYEPTTMPNVAFSLGYRFFGTADTEYSSPVIGPVETEYNSHSAELGARFSF